jgi:hypothetical protein
MIFRAIDAGVSVGLVDAVLGGLGGCGSEIDCPLTSSPGSFAMSMSLDYHHESLKCTCYLGAVEVVLEISRMGRRGGTVG